MIEFWQPWLAHGVGSRGTLPLPFWQFAWAAIAALALSFLGLGSLWREPRITNAEEGRVISGTRGVLRVGELVLRVVGLGLFALTLAAGLFGTDVGGEAINLAPVTIYVALWVAVPIVSALIGDIWKALNPFETIGLAFPQSIEGREPPAHRWIATAVLFAFLFLELVHPSGDSPRILGLSMILYSVFMVGGLALYGRRWLDRADGFGILFSLIAAISPFARSTDGSLRVRRPLSGLSTITMLPGTTMLLLTVLGGTSFDGFSESPIYADLIGRPRGWAAAVPNTIGLVVMIGIASVLYWAGARATSRVTGLSHEGAADLFAPSLIPIVWAYVIAHYAQLVVDQMQSFWFRLSNPFGNFDAAGNPTTDFFGAASNEVNFNLINPDAVAWVQALAIVIGHILAVLYAHDLAVGRFEVKDASRSQQTMLVVMVLYSVGGLWLLFAG